MFTSTRKRMQLNATKCIVKGISDEGGLFILDNFNGFDLSNNFGAHNFENKNSRLLSTKIYKTSDGEKERSFIRYRKLENKKYK